ncbi:MAG TPA: YdcF family protein, partial [Candidatus Eisenbacteria bacterium]|nr:YdcF family protein [Candidatus Eisenbacteria bacterium]
DAIFVFAGGHPRKGYAAELWRRGVAPVLIVSVGRFEWRRYAGLGLPGDAALRAAVERVPPRERHFFVVMERGSGGIGVPGAFAPAPEARVDVIAVPPRRFGTRNEARALASLARGRGWRSLIVISSAFHLRRIALVVRRALAGSGVSVSYAALPFDRDSYAAGRWWRTPHGVRVVLSEVVKLGVYRLFLGM